MTWYIKMTNIEAKDDLLEVHYELRRDSPPKTIASNFAIYDNNISFNDIKADARKKVEKYERMVDIYQDLNAIVGNEYEI